MVSELLLWSGSNVDESTVAVLVTVPAVEASTVTLTVTVAPAPAGSVPRAQVTFPLTLVQGLPWEGEALTKVRPGGKSSVTVTSWASDGPSFSRRQGVPGRLTGDEGAGLGLLGDGYVRARVDAGHGAGVVVTRDGVRRVEVHERRVRECPRPSGRVDPDDNADGAGCRPPAP